MGWGGGGPTYTHNTSLNQDCCFDFSGPKNCFRVNNVNYAPSHLPHVLFFPLYFLQNQLKDILVMEGFPEGNLKVFTLYLTSRNTMMIMVDPSDQRPCVGLV